MCGIVCIINLNGKETCQAESIHRMTSTMQHRGPDDEGYWFLNGRGQYSMGGADTPTELPNIETAYDLNSSNAFGHRRLSIIDLSARGHQPMLYGNRYSIIYNGEVYNYLELKDELETNGYQFATDTDTEVIMASYDHWGHDCLNKFNGMWAFIIYDTEQKKLFISRDRFGIKPLYYYKNDETLIFASEIKAILAYDQVEFTPNKNYIQEYLNSGPKEYIRETAFENIYHFSMASYIELSVNELRHKGINEKKFWELKPNLSNENFDIEVAQSYADKYYELLDDAVCLRLRADVKVGSALSGGLDSSSIVYLINNHLKNNGDMEKQETFSTVYRSENVHYCDESQYIDQLSNHLNVKSNQTEPSAQKVQESYKAMILMMENLPQSSHMSGWFTFQMVGDSDVTVTLDGQGADEQLAGYLGYIRNYFVYLPITEIVSEYWAFRKIPGIKMLNLYAGIVFNLLMKLLPKKWFSALLGEFLPEHYYMDLNESLKQSTTAGILTNLLHYSDSLSMAHTIESRVPFMDYRLVEFLASVPANYKVHKGWTKYISRLAMDGKLPDEITWRKDKVGWPQPEELWFQGDLQSWSHMTIKSSIFLQKLIGNDGIENTLNNNDINHILKLLNIAVWYEIFFEDRLLF